jgi:hypothetical protein
MAGPDDDDVKEMLEDAANRRLLQVRHRSAPETHPHTSALKPKNTKNTPFLAAF